MENINSTNNHEVEYTAYDKRNEAILQKENSTQQQSNQIALENSFEKP